MYTYPQEYDIIVVGAGHAGSEASLAAARMNATVLLLTLSLDTIAQMSCNPAIGGLAKGQIVREIDALGGEMAKNTDKTGIQFRMLNMSKGPAVQSPRAQCDRVLYRLNMKHTLERQKNLTLKQDEVIEIIVKGNKVCGVVTKLGIQYLSKAVIITTGTFLNGLIHIGLKNYPAGRYNEPPAVGLSDSLRKLSFEVKRLKTSTPPRINARTVDFSKLQIQYGDTPPLPFSHFTITTKEPWPTQKQLPCWITYTTSKTHQIIRDNLDRSPLYTGVIKGIGPRYCPSIEDKVVKFADKERHQVFLEPEGCNTDEMYCNGIFTSLPQDVQEDIVHSLVGCENAQIMRYGYGIEYDYCPPTQLKPTLETKLIENLYFAGQINGTTGYEEAAAQGIIAGINAVLKIRSQEPFILHRDEAYIGVLIDDLVTKGIMDPYRMFTSRAEYRLLLRNDNADLRLMDYGYKFGLLPREMYNKFCKYRLCVEERVKRLENTFDKDTGVSLAQLLRRGLSYSEVTKKISQNKENLLEDDCLPWTEEKVIKEVEIQIKYNGYIKHQLQEVEKFKKLENKKIPHNFDYDNIPGLLKEARIKLKQIQPLSIGQASRISGVTPADISILLAWLRKTHS